MAEENTYQRMLDIAARKGSGFILLIDPDKLPLSQIEARVQRAARAGVDIFFIGGSFLTVENFDEYIARVKAAAGDVAVIIFPGSVQQISPKADAILFLSLISGRNPEHLIGSQVTAAPLIWKMQLEAISCGYMLIESGRLTSVQYSSNSFPIPRQKPSIALAHGLAAQYLGMKSIYLEAGSGAEQSVPEPMIKLLREHLSIPIIAGGGIRTPEDAAKKARAGAHFLVIGNFFEEGENINLLEQFAHAIHHQA